MLAVHNLEVVYEDVMLAVRGASLSVGRDRVVALLGANGAGKTSLLRAMTGLLDVHRGKITRGEVTIEGRRLNTGNASSVVRAGVGQVMEGRRVFVEFTVEENLRVGGHTAGGAGLEEKFDRIYGMFPVLADRRRTTAGYLSGGEQQMLAIGRAMMSDPDYLLLDEPSLGLAPKMVERIRDLIVEINQAGTGILLIEQNAAMALSIAHHGYVMENGITVMDASADTLRADEDIQEFYLGVGAEGTSLRDVKHYKRRKRWLS
ncbi:ABC transporter ATP-binding protein [Ornithinimicrobium murale]|uniref:ABC transporter ATP-binding protein n=1 Tax=Ornithinimicrobium murale TaxID=1050153 RepID=UPI000E0CE442|nr:ABC transporter ATP-binding protein [Ornithinimicrobium murale]